jgi:hypothetical protein
VSLLVDGGDVGIAIFGWNRTYAGEERHLFSAPETGRKGLQAIR